MSLFLIAGFKARLHAQVILQGIVIDVSDEQPVIGANVVIEGTTEGTVTDHNGEYIINVNASLPITLKISYTGYDTAYVVINQESDRPRIGIKSNVLLKAVTITGSLNPDEELNPISSETMNFIQSRRGGGVDYYKNLASMKEIDGLSASFGFTILNTRGFASTSPVRTLQLIDGVDNQAPGLNFSLGNFLGVSELDMLKVEVIAGAAGAYYGPSAFNGVIKMETKDPFLHPGLSATVKMGERNLFEAALRYADIIKNKQGHDVFAFKCNVSALSVNDWKAENYDPITDSDVPATNPGGFDAVNTYGDEFYQRNDYGDTSCQDLFSHPGLGKIYRKGYNEVDIVDYQTENYKANIAFHFRTKPKREIDSPTLIMSSSYGAGTTVYQGDNRFSLRDINFFQNKIEFTKKDKYFIRAYHTYENAGNSYDPYFTALRLQESGKSNDKWNRSYENFWYGDGEIIDRMYALGYPHPDLQFDCDSAKNWLNSYHDSLVYWHALATKYANKAVGIGSGGTYDYYVPGTARFDSVFQIITTRLNNEQGGTKFYDKSSLFHIAGEYIFTPTLFTEIKFAGNYRLYTPDSRGTIFSDTSGTHIQNDEIGFSARAERKLFNQKIIGSLVFRADKNRNLKWNYTPAASIIYNPAEETTIRISISSAVRNPTLTDQYLFLNVGPAILSGHIGQVDSLFTLESFREYLNTNDKKKLDYFNIDAIRPEKVKTFEIGGRTKFLKNLYVDATYYTNVYRDFLGYVVGGKAYIDCETPIPVFKHFQVYRYTANTANKVTTHGFSLGLKYYIFRNISLAGNYSYNKLRKTVVDDPIIPAYNTPKNKFNIGISGWDLKISKSAILQRSGFSINYKWVEGFRFEGSPQFTGFVPAYGVVDAQINVVVDKIKTTIKIGSSNLFNNKHFEVYGGPKVGRHSYISLSYNF